LTKGMRPSRAQGEALVAQRDFGPDGQLLGFANRSRAAQTGVSSPEGSPAEAQAWRSAPPLVSPASRSRGIRLRYQATVLEIPPPRGTEAR
jgi:hypothetical protein